MVDIKEAVFLCTRADSIYNNLIFYLLSHNKKRDIILYGYSTNLQKKREIEMKYNVFELGIMVAIISFLGFIVENVWLAITKGYINNRNMNAPFLLGYGLLAVFLFFVLGTPNDPVRWGLLKKIQSRRIQYLVYFICSFVAVCIGEIILGTVVERLCNIEYWNYSNIPMHITKYTSVQYRICRHDYIFYGQVLYAADELDLSDGFYMVKGIERNVDDDNDS